MGRPLNKKYFGNTNDPTIGGEGIASVTVAGTNNNYTEIPALTVAAPSLPTGVTAEVAVASVGVATVTIQAGGTLYAVGDILTLVGLGAGTAATVTVATVDAPETGVITGVTVTTAGAYTTVVDLTALATTDNSVAGSGATINVTGLKINAVTVTTAGSGYTSVPAITDLPDGNATLTAVVTSAKQNAITMTGRIVAGSTVALDIIKQVSSRRYKVTDGTNTGIVELTGSAVDAAGEANVVATDAAAGTYYVTKITAHRAVLVPIDGNLYPLVDGTPQSAPWTLDAASTIYVNIANA